jgi:hypothetical protein
VTDDKKPEDVDDALIRWGTIARTVTEHYTVTMQDARDEAEAATRAFVGYDALVAEHGPELVRVTSAQRHSEPHIHDGSTVVSWRSVVEVNVAVGVYKEAEEDALDDDDEGWGDDEEG